MSFDGSCQKQELDDGRKPRSRSFEHGDAPVAMDQFGIIRGNDISRSSDSVPAEDPSLNLTDDDTSARVWETSENEFPPTQGSKEGVLGATTSDSEALIDVSAPSGLHSSDFHLQLDELTADITGASEDISKASDNEAKPAKQTTSRKSISPHQEETESLTEFEEIERLIQANTVQDSDDNLSDIPIDLEERILSGRASRVSSRSSRRSSRRKTSEGSGGSSARQLSSHSESQHTSDKSGENIRKSLPTMSLRHDTGYVTEGTNGIHSLAISTEDVSPSVNCDESYQSAGVTAQVSHEEPPSYNEHSENMLVTTDRSDVSQVAAESTTESLNNLYQGDQHSNYKSSSDESSTDDADVEQPEQSHLDDTREDMFVIPTHRHDIGDTNQPSSLVATFGTTEDFEVLLKQQLEDIEREDGNDFAKPADDQLSIKSQEEYITNETRRQPTVSDNLNSSRKRLPEEPSSDTRRSRGKSTLNQSRTTPRSSTVTFSTPVRRNKLKLPSNPSAPSPRESLTRNERVTRPRSQRATRSPAASRARRASDVAHGRPSRHPILRESSDDLSVRSDVSRTELRSKLKQEAKGRKRDKEFVKELKSNYDELLMKYAEAENTIDHLRLGAKINLFATMPHPGSENPTLPYDEAEISHNQNPSQQAETSNFNKMRPDRRDSRQSISSDTLIESSLQLPAAATKEFLKVALQLQAKDLQGKLESFETLLKETNLSPFEQQQAMENIDEALRNLERDYLAAIDEHAAEQRRLCIATGGSIDQNQEFDPGRVMEADIFGLGQRVCNLRDHIATQTQPEHIHISAPVSARSGDRSVMHEEVASSPEHDIDERFKELLHKYHRDVPIDDGHTTATSLNMSSHDEDDHESHNQSNTDRRIPNRYFEPAATPRDTSNITKEDSPRPDPSPSHVPTRRPRYRSSMSSMNESMTSASPSPTRRGSRLPRPIRKASRERHKPTASDEKKAIRTKDKGTDSGFVGSESSRQSANQPEPAKVKLVSRPPAAVDVTQASPTVTPPTPATRRGPMLSHSVTSSSPPVDRQQLREIHQQPSATSYIDRVGIYKPPSSSFTLDDSVDDVSTTSTVREMLRPPSRSYSTSSPPPATPTMKTPLTPYPKASKSGASLKSRGSSKRSVASTTKDSTLDMIRGEIARLREEIQASKASEHIQPILTSTPRAPLMERNAHVLSTSDNEALRAIRSDIKALKDEVHNQGRRYKDPHSTDAQSVRSADANTTRRRSRGERDQSARSRRSPRSRSLGRGELSEASWNESSPETTARPRRRSRSQDRHQWNGGYWTYVPPPPQVGPVWTATPAPMVRTYTRVASPVPAMVSSPPPPVVYGVPHVAHTTPIIGPPSNVYIGSPAQASSGRVYVPAPQRIYSTPSKPQASIYISPKRNDSPARSLRKANVYIIDSDDDQPLRRSHLSTLKRSSSMSRLNGNSAYVALPDSRLNDSIERAERSAERLRSQSRSMYKSVRDDLYKAQLLADTL